MTDRQKLFSLWIVICGAVIALGGYLLFKTDNLMYSRTTFGAVIILLIAITILINKLVHSASHAKRGMVKAMAAHYHVDPKHITVVDRIAYIDFPNTKKMLKINLVSLDTTMIHEHHK